MCVLGWLCILAKHLGTHAKASLPCLLLPLHRILPFPQQLQKDNNPSKIAITLASLVKGDVLSPKKFGRLPEGLPHLPYPFRFSDTSVNNPSIVGSASHCNRSSPLHKGAKGDSALPALPKPHYPSKIAITLASPRKRGGGTADTIFWLAVQYSDSPAFTILKLF